MTRPVERAPILRGPYFVLPASRDAGKLETMARGERQTDFVCGYLCGVITIATITLAAYSALRWLA